jgi:hypothetical protein
MEPHYDVVAVSLHNSSVLWVVGQKSAANAEAIIAMAVMRQGVEDRFFVMTVPGQYRVVDRYKGER